MCHFLWENRHVRDTRKIHFLAVAAPWWIKCFSGFLYCYQHVAILVSVQRLTWCWCIELQTATCSTVYRWRLSCRSTCTRNTTSSSLFTISAASPAARPAARREREWRRWVSLLGNRLCLWLVFTRVLECNVIRTDKKSAVFVFLKCFVFQKNFQSCKGFQYFLYLFKS